MATKKKFEKKAFMAEMLRTINALLKEHGWKLAEPLQLGKLKVKCVPAKKAVK